MPLEYAHGQGLVHLDLKVTNILIDRSGQPRLTDFGIASINPQQIRPSHPVVLTHAMSPSAATAASACTATDDIYALGVLLYELITGFPPFYPLDHAGQRVLADEPPQMECSPPLPTDFQTLVMKMLAIIGRRRDPQA